MEKMKKAGQMQELLELCGFEQDELPLFLPRIEKAIIKYNITPEDIENGKQRLNQYFDVSLKSIRKMLRFCVVEFVNCILSKEEGKTFISGIMIPGLDSVSSVLATQSNKVIFAQQNAAFLVVGCIFNKLVPVLEAAEMKWLKSGVVSHCANLKTLLGLYVTGLMPEPDLVISSGFLCDTAPKTLDLLHEIYGIPVYCYDTCQDRELREYSEASKRTVALAAKSLKKLVERIQDLVGFELKDDVLREGLAARSKLNIANAELRHILENSDPVPLSFTNDILINIFNSLTFSFDDLQEAASVINALCEELRERMNNGWGEERRGAPRLLAVLPCHYSDPGLEYLVEQMGMSIVSTDNFTLPYFPPQDLYEEMSVHLYTSLGLGLPTRIPLIIEGCKKLRIDGVINRYHVGCRTVTGDAIVLDKALKQKLGIPVLTFEWENFDPRIYNHEQYTEKLKILKTMIDNE
jgi:benzoyl-CoA reductase/2-hydroxyglutaryl-CoA dehydratase subunit BcrC/BadD/HgdB